MRKCYLCTISRTLSDSLCEIKINKDMRANDFLTRGEWVNNTYISPQVDVFNLHCEGILCESYDRPDYGYDDDNDLGEI